jgi:hypothetical protein
MDTYATKTASAISAGYPGSLGGVSATKMPADTITSDLGVAIAIAEANQYTASRICARLLGASPDTGDGSESSSACIGDDISRLRRALEQTRSVLETVETNLG